jgi:hypothetical protein
MGALLAFDSGIWDPYSAPNSSNELHLLVLLYLRFISDEICFA